MAMERKMWWFSMARKPGLIFRREQISLLERLGITHSLCPLVVFLWSGISMAMEKMIWSFSIVVPTKESGSISLPEVLFRVAHCGAPVYVRERIFRWSATSMAMGKTISRFLTAEKSG